MITGNPTVEQVQSLAGLIQAGSLVVQLARQGRYDRTAMHAASYSLIELDSDSVETVYGGLFGLDLGLRTMSQLFAAKPDANAREIYQYAAGMHQLALKLNKLRKTSEIIQNELAALSEKYLEYDDRDDEEKDLELQAALADLYSRTVSFMSPRIIVQGESGSLQDPDTVNRVRTALFSGIRAAFMWHQFGGRRIHLLFSRSRSADLARSIMAA